MSAATPVVPPAGLPLAGLLAGFKRFTADEYDHLVQIGVLTEHDNLELIEGYLVHKMAHNPPHDGTVYAVQDLLTRALPSGWICRVQSTILTPDSRPEPDAAVARGDRRTYFTRHPGPTDLALVVEVADSSLDVDRTDKLRIYSRSGLPEYWIVNLVDRQIEVYTNPQPAAAPPRYATRTDYRPGATLPLTLDGATVTIRVDDLLP
jgi:Uma2 family endonuclease